MCETCFNCVFSAFTLPCKLQCKNSSSTTKQWYSHFHCACCNNTFIRKYTFMRHLKGTSTLFCIILVFYLHDAEFKDVCLFKKRYYCTVTLCYHALYAKSKICFLKTCCQTFHCFYFLSSKRFPSSVQFCIPSSSFVFAY